MNLLKVTNATSKNSFTIAKKFKGESKWVSWRVYVNMKTVLTVKLFISVLKLRKVANRSLET